MAARRHVHVGENFGRAQAVINFALDSWDEFDGWCLIHGIQENPWKLPSYRFGALVVAYMKDDRTQEGLDLINGSLKEADNLPHPFEDPGFLRTVKIMASILTTPSSETVTTVIKSSLSDLPIEERKRREAAAAGKPYIVPSWWVGERTAFKTAKSMMGVLPKKIGKEG